MLVTTHIRHAGRRQGEARMVHDTVPGSGVEPLVSAAPVTPAEPELSDRPGKVAVACHTHSGEGMP
jgi:hypothetical protein